MVKTKIYRKNQSIYSISRGAYVKINDIPTMEGAIFALQQDEVNVHIGGQSALSKYHNVWHYLRKNKSVHCFHQKRMFYRNGLKPLF